MTTENYLSIDPGVRYTICGERGMLYDGLEGRLRPHPRHGWLYRFRCPETGSVVSLTSQQVRRLQAEGRILPDVGPGRAA